MPLPHGGMGSVVFHCLQHHLVALNQKHEADDGDHGAQAERDNVHLLGLPPVAAGTCRVLRDFPIPGLWMRRGSRAVKRHEPGAVAVVAMGRRDILVPPAIQKPGTRMLCTSPSPLQGSRNRALSSLKALS